MANRMQKPKEVIDDKKKMLPKREETTMSSVTAVQSGSVSGPVRIHTDPQHQAMTAEEKAMLKQNIQKLTNEQKHGILTIVQSCINKNKDNKTVEFELD